MSKYPLWVKSPVKLLRGGQGRGAGRPLCRGLLTPPAHRQDPGRLVPGSVEELLEPALKALLLFRALTQSEDAGGRVSGQRGPQGLAAGAAQQHVEPTGAGRLSATLRQAVGVTGQLRQQQHQEQHRNLLLDQRADVNTLKMSSE